MPLGDVPILGRDPAEHPAPPRSIEALEDEITTLAAQLTAATFRLLELLAEFDRREGWGGFGMKSCAHWLNWKCGIGIVAAREKVRVARVLQGLPKISDAMRTGTISYSKVRALTRIATVANESAVLSVALNGTAQHVERVAQVYRRTGRVEQRAKAVEQEQKRELSYYWDEDGYLVISGRLAPEQGAVVVKALQLASDALALDAKGEGDSAEAWAKTVRNADSAEASRGFKMTPLPGDAAEANPWRARQADALVVVAEAALSQAAHGAPGVAASDRHLVTLHLDAEALAKHGADDDVQCQLHEGPALARDVARRFACDASVVAMIEDARGEVLDVGRKTRVVSSALRRALTHRDRGCRYPGCLNTRFVDAHHVQHWADGGETKLGNLVLLCRRHHRLVHEGGFGIAMERGEVVVRWPSGVVLEHAPKVKARVGDSAEALARQNAARGVSVDARTSTPGWMGERADYNYIVAMIGDRDRVQSKAMR